MASPFKGILKTFMSRSGAPITVYRNYGTPQQGERTIPMALKNTRTKSGGGDVFQFLDREEIVEGDLIQMKGANDLWLVTDTLDRMDGVEFLHFEVAVVKANRQGIARTKFGAGHTVNIAGNVIGGVQVGTSHSSQSITVVQNQQVATALHQLSDAIQKSELDDIDKEELLHEVAHFEKLAARNDEKAKLKLVEKLGIIEKSISISQKLASIAMPLISMIRNAHGI